MVWGGGVDRKGGEKRGAFSTLSLMSLLIELIS